MKLKTVTLLAFSAWECQALWVCPAKSRLIDSTKLFSSSVSTHRENSASSAESLVQVHDRTFLLKPDNSTNVLYKREGNVLLRPRRKRVGYPEETNIAFDYKYNELRVVVAPQNSSSDEKTRITLLIQPIGVGIGRWYYDRLLEQFQSTQLSGNNIFLVPDLLGCGSGSAWLASSDGESTLLDQIPILNVNDWAEQLLDLMSSYEENKIENSDEVEWCLVSNGGCVPIALEIAKKYALQQSGLQGRLKHVILSATPRVESLLKPKDEEKIHNSYRTLSGVAGNLFWWYALRNDGEFIQKFSEKNLASKAENLGDQWRPKCVETAKAFGGTSKFSTFAFLAGSLNGGNRERFDALKGVKDVQIDVITGGDKRVNPAKSWFWDRSKTQNDKDEEIDSGIPEVTSLVPFLKENGNSGREIVVKGRRCPAHEDAEGFAKAITELWQHVED